MSDRKTAPETGGAVKKKKPSFTNIDFELRSPLVRRILFGVIAAVAVLFLVFQISSMGKNKVAKLPTRTALVQTVTRSISTRGVVVREESVLTADTRGTVVPRVENGSKVSAGDPVAEIFTTDAAAMRLLELDDVNSQISYYEAIQSLNSGNIYENKDTYNQNIARSLFDLIGCAHNNDLSSLTQKVRSFSISVAKKQTVIGALSDVSGRLDMLYDRKLSLEDAIASGAYLTADRAGYYVDRADGYEGAADYAAVQTMLPEDVDGLLSAAPGTVSNNVGKLITQFNWYLLCSVSAEEAALLKVGQKVNILLSGYSAGQLTMQLAAMNEGADGRVALVMRSNLMNSEIASLRMENVKICLEEYQGFALEKTALRTVDGQVGVYVQVGNVIKFRKVEIIYTDETVVLAEVKSENGYLRQYDEIITEGTDLHDGDIVS